MKKMISFLLAAIMVFTLGIPAFAATVEKDIDSEGTHSQIPVIRVLGDGEPLYDADGNKLFHTRTSFTDGSLKGDGDNSDIYEATSNILLPFLLDGLLNDEWDEYYENLEKEISDITGNARLDENGNAPEGTGISAERQKFIDYARTHDKKGKKGYYGMYDYHFWYDWRLDPFESAAKLKAYIDDVKSVTKCDKVAIMASCLGTVVTTTYIKMYGTEDLQGVGFTGSIAKGAESISEALSGKFDLNGAAIGRILEDCSYIGAFDLGEFVEVTIDLVISSGAINYLNAAMRATIYDKVVKGVTSALALSTLFTYPSYWAFVSKEDYEDALLHVFGEEGSAKRQQYAGLIKKIDNYNKVIRNDFDNIIRSIGENGVNFGAISKYGFQILPICKSYNALADQFVSVKNSSFGATTSTIYDTLSDEYIAERQKLGFGKYISPDKKIDASTCMYPDSTWFVKNSSHSEYTEFEKKILYDVVTADHQLTVNDFEWSQFMVYDYDTTTMDAMNEENCNTERWAPSEEEDLLLNEGKRIYKFVESIIKLILMLINRFFSNIEL